MHSSDGTKDRVRLWLQILSVSRAIESRLRENFRTEFGSTLPRFDVLAALGRHPDGLKMTELSAVLRVSNGNITALIDRLVEDGHAVRKSVIGDRRAHRVSLTEAGNAQFALLAAAHEGWIDELLGSMSAEDSKTATMLLKNLQDDV